MHRNNVHTGPDLKRWIDSNGLSYRSAAKLLGIHEQTMARWCKLPNLRFKRRWLPTLLLGAETKARANKDTRARSIRQRSHARHKAVIPRRVAEQSLPPSIAHLFEKD